MFAGSGNLSTFITLCAAGTFFVLCTVFATGSFGIGYPFPSVFAGSGNLGTFVTLCAAGTFFVL
ncbi:MAG: hypothetical protein IKV01_00595 [Clostridia bacterium]|nr:hypothetical protein [Clostridia bacterium]